MLDIMAQVVSIVSIVVLFYFTARGKQEILFLRNQNVRLLEETEHLSEVLGVQADRIDRVKDFARRSKPENGILLQVLGRVSDLEEVVYDTRRQSQ